MLVLTRRLNQKIIIGDDIHIQILGMNESTVCIGIHAPKFISVHREEIYERIQRSQKLKNKAANDQKLVKRVAP